MISRWLQDDVLERVQRAPIADGVGLSLAQLAVTWVLQNDNVAAAIIGASRPEQVTENVKAAGVTLDEATLKAIDEVVGPVVASDPAFTESPKLTQPPENPRHLRTRTTPKERRTRSRCHRRDPTLPPSIRGAGPARS